MTKLNEERWAAMSLAEQMANIGSEVGRSAKWLSKGKQEMDESAFLRALDLIDLTIKYGRRGMENRDCLLRELCRARECYTGAFLSKDSSTLSYLDRYFGSFVTACRPR